MLAIRFEYFSANVKEITDNLAAHVADRAQLEAQRAVFLGRLHRRSDDFEATRGLRIVSAELRSLPQPKSAVLESS